MRLEYLDKVRFRQGISVAYTRLRERGIAFTLMLVLYNKIKLYGKENIKSDIEKRQKQMRAKGEMYLIEKYVFNKRIRKWVKKKSYLDEAGEIFEL